MPITTNSSNYEIVQYAKAQRQRSGDIEIDDNAEVSRGDDPGVYVQAWVWVPFAEDEEDD